MGIVSRYQKQHCFSQSMNFTNDTNAAFLFSVKIAVWVWSMSWRSFPLSHAAFDLTCRGGQYVSVQMSPPQHCVVYWWVGDRGGILRLGRLGWTCHRVIPKSQAVAHFCNPVNCFAFSPPPERTCRKPSGRSTISLTYDFDMVARRSVISTGPRCHLFSQQSSRPK